MRNKESHRVGDNDSLGYDNLCVQPRVGILKWYKIPKFEMFNDTRNPMDHLRRYYDQMVEVRMNEALLMCLFSQSISSEDLDWFISLELKIV